MIILIEIFLAILLIACVAPAVKYLIGEQTDIWRESPIDSIKDELVDEIRQDMCRKEKRCTPRRW